MPTFQRATTLLRSPLKCASVLPSAGYQILYRKLHFSSKFNKKLVSVRVKEGEERLSLANCPLRKISSAPFWILYLITTLSFQENILLRGEASIKRPPCVAVIVCSFPSWRSFSSMPSHPRSSWKWQNKDAVRSPFFTLILPTLICCSESNDGGKHTNEKEHVRRSSAEALAQADSFPFRVSHRLHDAQHLQCAFWSYIMQRWLTQVKSWGDLVSCCWAIKQ